jgi:arylsulfatase
MSTSLSRALRRLGILIAVLAGIVAAVGWANARALGGGFYDGLDALLKRAIAVRDAARPQYQREVLAALPENALVGPVVRLDDILDQARIIEEPQRTDEYAGFENVFAWEFEQADLVSVQGKTRAEIHDGKLRVVHADGDFLRNAQPIAIVTEDVGEVVIRARATKGKHITLAWSRTANPDRPMRDRLQIPMIADGEFHNYVINARSALRRGLDNDQGNEIRYLAVQPSDVDGDQVDIDFIRFLSTRSKYMRKPRDVLYEAVAGDMRPVVSMLPRQTLEFSVHIPASDPRLSFGTAVIGAGSRVDFVVQIVGDTTTELHHETVAAPGAWHDANYDLRPWAGRDVAVRLTVDGPVGSVGLWSSPVVYGRPVQPLRVVVMLEDALRPDHLSLYGYEKPTSPFKEELLHQQGAVFMRARAQDNVTRASVPSMMTSLLPSVTGVWGFADMLSPEYLTIAEVMRQQGFATASFVQNSNAGPAAGLYQGFDATVDEMTRGDPEVLLEGEPLWNWLHGHKDRNSFVYLHIADPHGPYDPPPPYDAPYREIKGGQGGLAREEAIDADWVKEPTREGRIALYDGEIRHNDAVLRKFFARLKAEGMFDDTLFVFIADHGEHFGEHGVWSHRPPGTAQVTGVPLVLLHPKKMPKALRLMEPVQLLDVMPTVLEFAGVDASGIVMQGDSLVSLLEGRDPEFWRNRVVASEEVTVRDKVHTSRNTGLRVSGSLFYRDWHLIASRMFWPQRGYWPESLRLQVFNLGSDPHEHDAALRFLPDAWLRYRYTTGLNRLQSISEEAGKLFRGAGEQAYQFDPDTLEHLKALGYVE